MKSFLVTRYQKVRELYLRYERWLMSLTLVGGFLVDFLAFVNIDIFFKFTVLVVYWVFAGAAIAFMQVYDSPHFAQASRGKGKLEYLRLFMPLVVQWTFGGLLNISLIFYWFS